MTEISSIFSKMSDSRAVVQFVKEIEKYPCLYDQKSIEYANRGLKRKTWIHIARKSNCTVPECKEKWRKIRIAYIRTLKPVYQNGIRSYSRPYYLASYLKFISPFNKNIRNNNNLNTSTTENEEIANKTEVNTEELVDENDKVENFKHQVFLQANNNIDDIDGDDCLTEDSIDCKETVLNEVNKVKEVRDTNAHNNDNIENRKKCCESIECNPRKMFLLSLLPDIEALTGQQMRTFRREVIGLVDKLLYE